MTEVLAFDGVSRRFGERWVIRAGTLAVHAGEVVALLGRNGCGKTTMLRIACGIVRSESGHVRVHGRRIYRPRLHRLAAEGLFLLPERDLLTPTGTVGHHLERLASRWGGDPAEAIEMLGIGGLLDRFPVQLSGGERRRAELALAVARRPAVLLADEPFQGIAPVDVDRIALALRHLRAAGCGILVTGHEVEALLDLADTVVWMTAGTTHALGAPERALSHHSFRLDYLGPRRGRHHG